MNNTREIISKIEKITGKKDKNGNDYLILEVDNDGDIFVFPFKVVKETWLNLHQGKTYFLVISEGKNGLNILDKFKIERKKDE